MAVFHRIYTCIFINISLLLLSILMLTPSKLLAQDALLATEEFFLDVFINGQPKDTVLLLRNEGRLFGSVTTADIVSALTAQAGVTLDRKKIVAQPIRTTGSHTALVRLHADVECTIKLSVVAG